MIPKVALVAGLSLMTACGTVESERTGTIVVDGLSYQLRERTINGRNGPYEHTSVRVSGNYYTCLPDSPGDCEAAVRRGRDRFDDF
jgi:hypothetical protein